MRPLHAIHFLHHVEEVLRAAPVHTKLSFKMSLSKNAMKTDDLNKKPTLLRNKKQNTM